MQKLKPNKPTPALSALKNEVSRSNLGRTYPLSVLAPL